ncbi:MAG: GumC family protein [Puniceicoccales bacterium]
MPDSEQQKPAAQTEREISRGTDVPVGFKFPLPLDPLRWLYGMLARWYWFVGLALVLTLAGFFIGLGLAQPRYSVSLQLIKKPIPAVIKAGDVGDAFRPRQLNDRSLEATLLAAEAVRNTARAQGIDPDSFKGWLDIAQLEGTDFFYLTVHSPNSAQQAIDLVQLWADEVIRYTVTIQRREAMAMSQLLQNETDELKRGLEEANKQLLAFSTEHDYLDGDKQLEAFLRSSAALELQLEDARISLATVDQQLINMRRELQAQSPISEQLRASREELAILRGRYTDANPLVKEKIYQIEYLEDKLKAQSSEQNRDDLQQYTGTPLGNQLYLEIVQLRNQKLQLEKSIQEYERLIENQKTRLQKLPRQMLRYRDILKQRDNLQRAYELLSSRLQEARIFTQNAPGYWEVFQKPGAGDVNIDPDRQKGTLLGGAGFMMGMGIAFVITLILEIRRPRMRTSLEFAIAARARPVLDLPSPPDAAAWERELSVFWLTQIVQAQREGFLLLLTTDAPEGHEAVLWEALAELARIDRTRLSVLDLSHEDSALVPPTSASLRFARWDDTSEWETWVREHLEEGPVVMRLRGRPYPAILPALEKTGQWLCLVDTLSTQPSELRRSMALYCHNLEAPDGLILVQPESRKPVARLVDRLGVALSALFKPRGAAAKPS